MGKLRNYFLNHYPRTDFHELNEDWMISMLFDMINQVENFVEMNSVKYADPIQWGITRQYEKNTNFSSIYVSGTKLYPHLEKPEKILKIIENELNEK